jgi:hypothetical protein
MAMRELRPAKMFAGFPARLRQSSRATTID